MRTIAKGPEPASLTRHRSTPGADWDGYAGKAEARARLCQEQQGLCAFCLSRIRDRSPAEDHECGIKVAHWWPRRGPNGDPSLQLRWSNLLGCCPGGEFGGDRHCDTAQGDARLTLHPVFGDPRPEEVIRCEASGRLVTDDPAVRQEIEVTLNLNCEKLRRKRAAVVDGVFRGLDRRSPWTLAELRALERRWERPGPDGLPEFNLFALARVRRRIAQMTKPRRAS